jgi:TPR repeat protein
MNDKGIDRYIGFLRYIPGDPGRESGASEMPVDHEFDHVLTAQDVIRSAIRRHGYHWAYWVQLMVVDGEYSPNEVPAVDKEYLRGVADVEKMTNFKEFVIRSDEGIRTMFENNDNYWRPLSFMLDNKTPVQKFYMGFLSQLYIYPGDGVDGAPNLHAFSETLTNGYGSYSPKHPNYVACLIPYTDEERGKGIVPEFAATGSSLRYTSVQGYSESKKFYSPDYGRMRPQESDYRRTLLWVPDIEINDKGEAVMELYNSSTCTALTASVEGRNGRVLFSNGETITTRGGDIAVQGQGAAPARKEEDVIIEETIDPELRKACDAEQEKGVIYYNQKRYKDAIMIFAELVQYKYPPALYYVGRCYRDGTGVSRNEKLALQFMLEAARRNEPAAQYELAMMLFEGEVVQRDEAKGLEWLARATDNGEPRAMLETALRLRDGNGMAPDTGKSNALLEKAALAGLPAAMHEHGMRLLGDGGDGLQFIIDAAAAQHEPAMVYMLEHEHNAGNYKEAYKYAKKLSLIGNHHGTKRMGDYYMEGNGVKRDKSLARDLYREAAANGNAEAKRILEGK